MTKVPDHLPDRLPPHDIETEAALLGSILLDTPAGMADTLVKLPPDGTGFYDLRHQRIFRTMVELDRDKGAFDIMVLADRIKEQGLAEETGGIQYLMALQDQSPSAAMLPYYRDAVHEKWMARQVIKACSESIAQAYDHEPADVMLDRVEKRIMEVGQTMTQVQDRPMKELVGDAIDYFERCHRRGGGTVGIPTGYPDLDKLTGGLVDGNMIVLAARPSIGKTSMAMNIAEHAAVEQGVPVGVFSLEMPQEQLIQRMICSRARVNLRNVFDGALIESDFPKLTMSASKLSRAPIHIDDSQGLLILQLRARARRMAQRYGIKLLVIDYLQLLSAVTGRNDNRVREISDISNGIKQLAKELSIPVIVLSQLNRNLEREKGREPRLSDLKESSSIEQDADLVALLSNNRSDEDDEDRDTVPVKVNIAKHRNGPTGYVYLTFLKHLTRMESASKIDAGMEG